MIIFDKSLCQYVVFFSLKFWHTPLEFHFYCTHLPGNFHWYYQQGGRGLHIFFGKSPIPSEVETFNSWLSLPYSLQWTWLDDYDVKQIRIVTMKIDNKIYIFSFFSPNIGIILTVCSCGRICVRSRRWRGFHWIRCWSIVTVPKINWCGWHSCVDGYQEETQVRLSLYLFYITS